MTLAICWKCGAQKIGALTPCTNCEAVPTTSEDKAVSILLSDHYRAAPELEALGNSIAAGEPPQFDAVELTRVLSVVQDNNSLPRGCTVAVWMPVVLLGILVLAVGTLYILGAYK